MEFDVDINHEEIRRLERAMKDLGDNLAADIHQHGAVASARVARDRARELVPRREGALARSIRAVRSTLKSGRGRPRILGARLLAGSRRSDRAAHAVLVEYGTVHAAAQPFIAPAVTGTQSAQLSAYQSGVGARFGAVVRNLARGGSGRIAQLAARG